MLIIKEYEGWINLMLQMLNIKQENINHIDIATPIQKVNYINQIIFISPGIRKIAKS